MHAYRVNAVGVQLVPERTVRKILASIGQLYTPDLSLAVMTLSGEINGTVDLMGHQHVVTFESEHMSIWRLSELALLLASIEHVTSLLPSDATDAWAEQLEQAREGIASLNAPLYAVDTADEAERAAQHFTQGQQ